ncbi:penicillin acylase family protein [Mesorhizobium sp.]|uniref:penicillin acylase family protein n=1 Tax=Mesorhizobium sp. TaxID=1871066 RepID=UPI0025B9378C|nr:penicillin acylase family protein [Mesorhizobium sp.]
MNNNQAAHERQTIVVSGLESDAEILVDRWGIPHIYAKSEHDVFFVQGFNVARDRLWQIDMWRKRGLGRLAVDLGPGYVERDRAARMLLYRGDMDAEWASYGGNARSRTAAFVAGINAYVDMVEREHDRLPLEFKLTDARPERWEPEDVVRCRSHALVRNLDFEVVRMNIVAKYGIEGDRLHRKLQPSWKVYIPEGLQPHIVPPEVMRTYLLGCDHNPLAAGHHSDALNNTGSNNWALMPSRTTTGRAILASDPHRLHDQPSLRYIAHLNAPGLNVIGAGEPAIPGVSLGHNERLAFSLTIHPTDQADLYVYELDPEDSDLYRYQGGWERMRVATEQISVRNGPPHSVELRFTRHGPVLHVDQENRRAYALRSIWWEPGTAAYMGSLAYLQAMNFQDYCKALTGWGAPSTNHVVADVDGHIGWAVAAKLPVRQGWDGLMPVPGDGRYEWNGTYQAATLIQRYDPSSGWLGSANQMNLPSDFDWQTYKTCFEWSDEARFTRLSEAIEERKRWSVEETLSLQADVLSITARRICKLLDQCDVPAPSAARMYLANWDHRLEVDSGPAALFEVWFTNHLLPAIPEALGPEGLASVLGVQDTALALDLLETADHVGFGPDGRKSRDQLLIATLERAWVEVQARLGGDSDIWRWGDLHKGYFRHPLSAMVSADVAKHLDIGPAPRGGSGLTINNNGYRGTDFRVMSGVTWRMVLDVGNWDACWTINSPGQSGDPESPHYRDLFDIWARDGSIPMLFSRDAIEAATELCICLSPSGD